MLFHVLYKRGVYHLILQIRQTEIQKRPPELAPCWPVDPWHQTSGLQTPHPEATSTEENIWMPYKVKKQCKPQYQGNSFYLSGNSNFSCWKSLTQPRHTPGLNQTCISRSSDGNVGNVPVLAWLITPDAPATTDREEKRGPQASTPKGYRRVSHFVLLLFKTWEIFFFKWTVTFGIILDLQKNCNDNMESSLSQF